MSVTNKHMQMNDIRDRARRIYHKYLKSGDIKFIENMRSLNLNTRESLKITIANNFLYLESRTRLIKDDYSLTQIDKLFEEKKIVFIVGLPGMGKSTLARQYSEIFLEKDITNNIVLSFRMDSVTSIREKYFSTLIDLLFSDETAKMIQQELNQGQIQKVNTIINSKLASTNNKFLFVFDDFLKDETKEASGETENKSSIKLLKLILANMKNPFPVQVLITTKHSEDNFCDMDNASFFQPEMFDDEKAKEFFRINGLTRRKFEESDIVCILEKLNSKEHLPFRLCSILI